MSGSITQHKDSDVEDVFDSEKGNVTASCEDKTSQITEKDNEIANIIPKLKPTECNEKKSQIEELFTKNSIE